LPTLLDILNIEEPELKHDIQGKSLHALMQKGESLKRDYIVSESWSQAAIIAKDFKLGKMLDPTNFRKNFDYRSFGDMFFNTMVDSLELNNEINNSNYASKISELEAYYEDFKKQYPDIGKQEIINQYSN
jgi:hypothetical protein